MLENLIVATIEAAKDLDNEIQFVATVFFILLEIISFITLFLTIYYYFKI